MSAEVVAQVKQELLAAGHNCDGPCGAFKILSTAAWRLRASGWGLIFSTGNGCTPYEGADHFRVDTMMQRNGSVIDCLGMAESNEGLVYPQVSHDSYNIPQWNPTGGQDPANWREPYDPGLLTDDGSNGGTDPGTGVPDSDAILLAISDSEERVKAHTTAETERVLTKLNDLRDEVIAFAELAEEFLKKLAVLRREGRPEEPPPEA